MAYLLLIVFMIGAGGMISTFLRTARRRKVRRLLEMNSHEGFSRSQASDDTTPVEKILTRTSRLVFISSMLDKNVIAKAVIVSTLVAILFLLNVTVYEMSTSMMLLAFIGIIIVVILLPSKIKNSTINKKMKRISTDLPFVIDMVAVSVQSGMTIEKALRYIGDNIIDINPDIASLLDRTMLRTDVSGIGAALDQLYEDVPCEEVRMFCSTLQQSIKYGSSVYQVLIELSQEMRQMQLLSTEEKVASLSAKMTVPMIIFIVFPLLVLVAGPGFLGMMELWK
jgi:tight adherence protein C